MTRNGALKEDQVFDKFNDVLTRDTGDTSVYAILRKNPDRVQKNDPEYLVELSESKYLHSPQETSAAENCGNSSPISSNGES